VSAVVAPPPARLDHQWLTAHMVHHLVQMTLGCSIDPVGTASPHFLNSLLANFDTAALGRLLRRVP
jgi:hypothetical protein